MTEGNSQGRERAALLADGRREAVHGIPPAASNGTFTSTQLRQASSKDSTEKFQGQGRPTQAAGPGQVPTGAQSTQPFRSRGAHHPSSTPRQAGGARAAAPSRLRPLHLAAGDGARLSGTCLPAPEVPISASAISQRASRGLHPSRLSSRTRTGSARGPPRSGEGAPGTPRPGSSSPTPCPRGAPSPQGARTTRRRAWAPWCRRHRRLPLSPAYRRPRKQRREGAEAAARERQRRRPPAQAAGAPPIPRAAAAAATPASGSATDTARPAHSARGPRESGARGLRPRPLRSRPASDGQRFAFGDRLRSGKARLMRPLIGQKAPPA